ncbi:MAG: primosomal protein N' [Pseudomonadota bacterium]
MAVGETRVVSEADADGVSSRPRVRVLLPLPLRSAYDYRAAQGLALRAGDFVRVPLGRRTVVGVLWDGPVEGRVADQRLKAVESRLDVPPLPPDQRRFIDWVAAYTLSPPGAVLRMAMSVPEALAEPRARLAYAPGNAPDPEAALRLTPARRRALEALGAGPPLPPAELKRRAGVGAGVLGGLLDLGWIKAVEVADPPPASPDGARPGLALSEAQRAAGAELVDRLGGGFSVTLLDGVTGAGKTEVYFEAVAAALRAGRQTLVLLPEIALSAQWLERFSRRFGAAPAVWHSELGRAHRRATWRQVADRRARVVVGARSALFLPFPELGLIVVDEEHEAAFKQEDGVVYHARDMAVVRARIGRIPIVLVSATPSLETVVNVERGRYSALRLPDRHGGARLPEVEAIDLRRDPPPPRAWLSAILRREIAATLETGEQAMLFLNRRGYAPLTLCRACGHRMECPSCTAWLVEHRRAGTLQCHHCGFAAAPPALCPGCGAADSLVACGPGVERLAEEATSLFPAARIEIMTSDTIAGPRSAAEFVRKMEGRDIDLLIGTQIVAKGHHFPSLTLVGVVDADLGLAGGDLRAAERTYQLLHQVAGRAGRAERPGKVWLQTYMPEHPVLRALVVGPRDRFLAAEAAERRRHGLPPYGRLAAVIVSAADERTADRLARRLAEAAPSGPGLTVLGPAPAPLAVLRGRHRRRLLVKAAREVDLQAALRSWLARVQPPASARIQVDVDPYSFM